MFDLGLWGMQAISILSCVCTDLEKVLRFAVRLLVCHMNGSIMEYSVYGCICNEINSTIPYEHLTWHSPTPILFSATEPGTKDVFFT